MPTSVPKLTLAEALQSARETRTLEIGSGILPETPRVFAKHFAGRKAVLVADPNTYRAAGAAVQAAFGAAALPPIVIEDPDLYAESRFVERVEAALKPLDVIAVAVGSGTVNDLTKLASHRHGREYMCVATAASMDGYTAFGASITHQGAKQTFFCPAPTAVVADLEVIAKAPAPMNAWGYVDLVAKVTAGADWILADALGAEPIDARAWSIVQGRLGEMISDPAGVRANLPGPLGRLIEGLMLGGFAMQSAQSSRPASGAEHQFSHLWDMQHHTHNGKAPSHGFKVGIGTLAVTALYEQLLEMPLETVDFSAHLAQWPDAESWKTRARALLGAGELGEVGEREVAAKHIPRAELEAQLRKIRQIWPELRLRLRRQLLPLSQLRQMLVDAGAPVEAPQIGISLERLRDSYLAAWMIRRRFTVLDLAVRAGLLEPSLARIFGAGGVWPLKAAGA